MFTPKAHHLTIYLCTFLLGMQTTEYPQGATLTPYRCEHVDEIPSPLSFGYISGVHSTQLCK